MRLVCAGALLTLAGCSRGLDSHLNTSEGKEKYHASLNAAAKDFSQEELDAFNWAVSDLSLENLNARYPGAAPRQVIRGEVALVLAELPAKIVTLEQRASAYEIVAAELRKVVATDVRFTLQKGSFDLEPVITATITNGSEYAISDLKWEAALFLDGSASPSLHAELFQTFKRTYGSDEPAGLRPGQSTQRRLYIGGLEDDNWTTLEIQNAGERKVALIVVPSSVRDFGERWYAGDNPAPELRKLKGVLAAARRYQAI